MVLWAIKKREQQPTDKGTDACKGLQAGVILAICGKIFPDTNKKVSNPSAKGQNDTTDRIQT